MQNDSALRHIYCNVRFDNDITHTITHVLQAGMGGNNQQLRVCVIIRYEWFVYSKRLELVGARCWEGWEGRTPGIMNAQRLKSGQHVVTQQLGLIGTRCPINKDGGG